MTTEKSTCDHLVKSATVSNNYSNKKLEQGVQELQAFAFGVVRVNDEHMKPRFQKKCTGYI